MLYIAADNDLEIFLDRNLKQMTKVGSTEHANIVALVNTSEQNPEVKFSKTVYIEKGNVKILKQTTTLSMTDSGDPEVLINFCLDAIKQFPAEKYALIFWNHGTGAIDPLNYSRVYTADTFSFSMEENETDGFSFFKNPLLKEAYKGVCFDETTGNYLDEQKMIFALNKICLEGLSGNKIDLIGFDACLMAMIEIAASLQPYAHYMASSQEVELGTGWNYSRAFSLFAEQNPSPENFGTHITQAYAKTYGFTNDYTFSCVHLDLLPQLQDALKELSLLLVDGCRKEPAIKELITASRYRHACTHFDDPDFIDLHHFLTNLLSNAQVVRLSDSQTTSVFKETLYLMGKRALSGLEQLVIANKTGRHFPHARGLSIYFPEYSIHRSYKKNKFAHEAKWFFFLSNYLS